MSSVLLQPRPETDWSVLQWAVWQHLNTDEAYVARKLKEFREFDGELMPFNVEEDHFDYDQLPLHASTVIGGGTGVVFPGTSHERDWVKLRMVVARRATAHDLTSAEIERDMKVITQRLRGKQNRSKLLQLVGTGCECQFEFAEGPHAGRDFKRGGPPQQWIWAYTVALYGPGRTVL